MAFREELERSGARLFRYRSWAPPLLLMPLTALAAARPPEPGLPQPWLAAGVAIVAAGLLTRAMVVGYAPAGTSGKNRIQKAESLTTSGMYAVVRHPLYLANALLWLGPAVAVGNWVAPVLVLLVFSIYCERIVFAEEEFLRESFGNEFLVWAARTPAFVPAVRRWRRPALPFSLRTVLRQEYYAWVSAATLFVLLEVLVRWRQTGRPSLERSWLIFLGAVLVAGAVLRTLQRATGVLDVDDR